MRHFYHRCKSEFEECVIIRISAYTGTILCILCFEQVSELLRVCSNCAYAALIESILASQWVSQDCLRPSGYSPELVARVSWARALLPLKTRRVDKAIPPTDVVVRKEWFQLRCPPRHPTKALNYKSASNKEFLFVRTKNRTVHRRQPLRVVVVEDRVTEGIASIQRRQHTFRKQKANHYPPFLLGEIKNGVAMLNGLLLSKDYEERRKTSDT
ncbi:hypothetical protein TNCV_34141 [Trichonephila clavipes]|nr:hypothetical protein TNCV_34141 [Trichonephila clavipes]